ncbi:MAG: photosystem I reaction center subunit PsaK [Nostocaceae cyanobacterium]|nr:photosystem I reaction center subunit PsaK [Nostocaceae cyanobacterium]
MSSILIAQLLSVPPTPDWNFTVGIIISLSCLVAVILTSFIKYPEDTMKMPGLPLTIPAFIAAMCFGHVIGVGIVLGLTNIGSI